MVKISITHLGNAHSDWLRSLDFYKGEIRILRNRLTEIAGKNTAPDILAKVEQFENQFNLQTENIDRLTHDINHNLASISKEAQAQYAGYIDGILLALHNQLSERFNEEEKVINELRHRFNDFAAAWM